MGKSDRLRVRELREIFRIIGDCRELGGDAFLWRTRLLEATVDVLGARVAVAGEFSGDAPSSRPGDAAHVYIGFGDDRDRLGYFNYLEHVGYRGDPFIEGLKALMARSPRPGLTRRRKDVLPGRGWYRSEHYHKYHRPAGVDDGMMSLHAFTAPCGERRLHFITLRREVGDLRFVDRERRMLDWLHAELVTLLGRTLATADAASVAELSPRAREVLGYLLEGATEKETAERLDLSPETVHDYVKRLYRHFGVRSRARLLARWIRAKGG